MQELLHTLLDQAHAYSMLEVAAVAMALLYLMLAIRQNIWCWACAGISTSIYVYLAFDARLYMQSLLNVFYFAMAIYGWHVWFHGRHRGDELAVISWSLSAHGRALLAIAAAGAVSGFILRVCTDATFPFVDSMSAWAAIWATFLVARKVLENWWYWLVIDAVSVLIYWSRDLQLTALLFVIYVIMIPFGYLSWSRSRQQSRV